MKLLKWLPALIALLITAEISLAEDKADQTAFVRLPLSAYDSLVELSRNDDKFDKAPSGYSLGKALVALTAAEKEDRVQARIEVDLEIKVHEDKWTSVPILPAGTPVESATVAGRAAEITVRPDGLFWIQKKIRRLQHEACI